MYKKEKFASRTYRNEGGVGLLSRSIECLGGLLDLDRELDRDLDLDLDLDLECLYVGLVCFLKVETGERLPLLAAPVLSLRFPRTGLGERECDRPLSLDFPLLLSFSGDALLKKCWYKITMHSF